MIKTMTDFVNYIRSLSPPQRAAVFARVLVPLGVGGYIAFGLSPFSPVGLGSLEENTFVMPLRSSISSLGDTEGEELDLLITEPSEGFVSVSFDEKESMRVATSLDLDSLLRNKKRIQLSSNFFRILFPLDGEVAPIAMAIPRALEGKVRFPGKEVAPNLLQLASQEHNAIASWAMLSAFFGCGLLINSDVRVQLPT